MILVLDAIVAGTTELKKPISNAAATQTGTAQRGIMKPVKNPTIRFPSAWVAT